MITASWPRLVIGTLILFIGAASGLLAWSVETCARDSAGSLWMGAIALAANAVAWTLLGRRVPSKPVLFVAALPALAAVSYSLSTFRLAKGYVCEGLSACAAMKPGQEFGFDGREPLFIGLWLLVVLSFWGGLAPVVARLLRVHGGMASEN